MFYKWFCFHSLGIAGILLLGLAGSAPGKQLYPQSLGVFGGSIGLAGLRYEKAHDPEQTRSLAYLVGTIAGQDVEVTQQLRYYFFDLGLRPYAGLGLCEVLGASDNIITFQLSVTGSLGLDWRLLKHYHCGVEFCAHYLVYDFPLTGDETRTSTSIIERGFFFWPGVYVAREF